MSLGVQRLLDECTFPPPGTGVSLAVSGGPDSLGLLLLALEARLAPEVHHVNHHARANSGVDARFVKEVCVALNVTCVVHDVEVSVGGNFEARARGERRRVLPRETLTGHTMDDVAETVLLNMLRGAGLDGLSPMVNDPTKPLRALRRRALHEYVNRGSFPPRHDESNDDLAYQRNRVRHQILPLLCDVAQRDVVPLLARQAHVVFEERSWLDELAVSDAHYRVGDLDCRELREWPRARLRRWLRAKLFVVDEVGDQHPPSAAEVERALGVVLGDVVATQLSGARRLARRGQHLTLDSDSTTLTGDG